MNNYLEDGYAIVRNVFSKAEVEEMGDEIDRLKIDGMKHPSSFRHGNIFYLIEQDPSLGPILRFLHWSSYISPVMNRYRTDTRQLDIVEPFIGNNLKQIGNQIIWKPPGATTTSYSYHQDSRFRRPATAYRKLGESYIQTAIAIDPHSTENGCVKIVKGSHHRGPLEFNFDRSVFTGDCIIDDIAQLGYKSDDIVDVELAPGDVALWSPYTIHGSGPNNSKIDRRSYLNGYVTAENCDVGEWAFRDGKPCVLGEQQMVQYEDLYERPEPYYITGTPNPYSLPKK